MRLLYENRLPQYCISLQKVTQKVEALLLANEVIQFVSIARSSALALLTKSRHVMYQVRLAHLMIEGALARSLIPAKHAIERL
jgi:hypothetical protein